MAVVLDMAVKVTPQDSTDTADSDDGGSSTAHVMRLIEMRVYKKKGLSILFAQLLKALLFLLGGPRPGHHH